jgi:hypothetical protein
MTPPPPLTDQSEYDRFKRFTKATLSDPKSEITPPEQALAKLESERQKAGAKIVKVQREMAKQKSARR